MRMRVSSFCMKTCRSTNIHVLGQIHAFPGLSRFVGFLAAVTSYSNMASFSLRGQEWGDTGSVIRAFY